MQGYSRVIMGLTNIETQPVIQFHGLRRSIIFMYLKKNGFSFFFKFDMKLTSKIMYIHFLSYFYLNTNTYTIDVT
jgi:hypothetical protein